MKLQKSFRAGLKHKLKFVVYLNGESLELRGGNWNNGANAGVFNLNLNNAPENRNNNIGFRCASDPVAISQSDNLGTGLVSSYSNRVGIGNVSNGKLVQSVNLGNTDTYEIWTYLYDRTLGNVGGTVNSNVAELYANGEAITTEYTDMRSTLGSGWWKLSGTVVGADESREYGLLVKTGKTVDVDNFTLIKQSATPLSIYTTTAYSNDKVASWPSITTDEENIGASAVLYQVCTEDGSTCESNGIWKYYDGASWQTASNTTTHANTKLELTDTAMAALPVSSHKLSSKLSLPPTEIIQSLTH